MRQRSRDTHPLIHRPAGLSLSLHVIDRGCRSYVSIDRHAHAFLSACCRTCCWSSGIRIGRSSMQQLANLSHALPLSCPLFRSVLFWSSSRLLAKPQHQQVLDHTSRVQHLFGRIPYASVYYAAHTAQRCRSNFVSLKSLWKELRSIDRVSWT